MGRVIKSHMVRPEYPATPDAAEVAPHRYTWESEFRDLDSFGPGQWEAMMAAVPYKAGEVVYIDRGGVAAKALILDVFVRRDPYHGHRRPQYRVAMATAKGQWSKLWEMTFPGFIQRGYVAAGMAPDCEGKL